MTKEVHEIDPNADTVIVLTKPLENFAAWDIPEPEATDNGPQATNAGASESADMKDDWDCWGAAVPKSKKKSKRQMAKKTAAKDNCYSEIGGFISTPSEKQNQRRLVAKSFDQTSTSPLPSVLSVQAIGSSDSLFGDGTPEPSSSSQNHRAIELEENERMARVRDALADKAPESSSAAEIAPPSDESTLENEDGVHYRVSSRHLILASRRFRTMMSDKRWKEGVRSNNGIFYVYTTGWDPEVFLMLMHIVHLQSRKVPRRIGLEMLTKFAVLVDYYQCEEAVEMFTSIWIEALKTETKMPTTYCRDLILWLCVAQVFDLPEQFSKVTNLAIRQSKSTIRTLDLPIWPTVVDNIDNRRYQAIESAVSQLHALLDKYRSMTYSCDQSRQSLDSFLCGSFLLGALTRELDRLGLLSPRPEVPFHGLSFEDICVKARKVQSPSWKSSAYSDYYGSMHTCNLTAIVEGEIVAIATTIEGLILEEYKRVNL